LRKAVVVGAIIAIIAIAAIADAAAIRVVMSCTQQWLGMQSRTSKQGETKA
jgi:hypothetical protein